MLSKFLSLIQSKNDIDVLTTAKEYIQSSILVLELKHIYYEKKETFRSTIYSTPNSNYSKQHRFLSTKKRRRKQRTNNQQNQQWINRRKQGQNDKHRN